MAYYKYLSPKYADLMLSSGSFRIGTLSGFRAIEAQDAERGDIGEGTRTLHSNPGRTSYGESNPLPGFIQGIKLVGEHAIVTEGENAIVINESIPDLYIYCVASRFDAELMKAFGGACIQINSPQLFFAELDRVLRDAVNRLGNRIQSHAFAECVYKPRRQNWHLPVENDYWYTKPDSYSHQFEVRAAWQPASLPIQPLNIECPAATVVCERIA